MNHNSLVHCEISIKNVQSCITIFIFNIMIFFSFNDRANSSRITFSYLKMWQLKSLCFFIREKKDQLDFPCPISHCRKYPFYTLEIQKIWNDLRISEFSAWLCNFKKKVWTKIYHMGYKISLLDRNDDYMTKFQIT